MATDDELMGKKGQRIDARCRGVLVPSQTRNEERPIRVCSTSLASLIGGLEAIEFSYSLRLFVFMIHGDPRRPKQVSLGAWDRRGRSIEIRLTPTPLTVSLESFVQKIEFSQLSLYSNPILLWESGTLGSKTC